MPVKEVKQKMSTLFADVKVEEGSGSVNNFMVHL